MEKFETPNNSNTNPAPSHRYHPPLSSTVPPHGFDPSINSEVPPHDLRHRCASAHAVDRLSLTTAPAPPQTPPPMPLRATADKAIHRTLQTFFADYGNQEIRELLWTLFKCSISGHFAHMNVVEKQNMVSFYESLDRLFEELSSPGSD